jgi:ribosomal protein S21
VVIPLAITIINHVKLFIVMTDNPLDDAAKKMKNSQQDAKAEAETAQDHAEGKPSSETLNKAKEKVKDAFS